MDVSSVHCPRLEAERAAADDVVDRPDRAPRGELQRRAKRVTGREAEKGAVIAIER